MLKLPLRDGAGAPKAALDGAGTAALDAFHTCPSLDLLVPALVEGGIEEMRRRCSLTPGEHLGLTLPLTLDLLVLALLNGGFREKGAGPSVQASSDTHKHSDALSHKPRRCRSFKRVSAQHVFRPGSPLILASVKIISRTFALPYVTSG